MYLFVKENLKLSDCADIQLKNLLMPSADALLPNIEQGEMEDPSARKVVDDIRTIYTSRLLIPGNGLPLISDLGECRSLEGDHSDDIMPNQYKAPEVLLKMNWDCKVDIWNVAMLVSQPLDVFHPVHTDY